MSKINLFELYAKIGMDTSDYEKGINRSKADFSKFSSFTIAKGQLIADAIKAGAKALIDFGKGSITAYADYEQLEGGVKKLFGNDMQTVIENANQAYKTAGMSANQYMETVTSFSASLVNGLGGDTAKAAEYADKAIRDMSDNANTFGTDIAMLQTTYNAFAKQNYTLLDNLKLGYGGNAEEMARLINDSGVLGSKMKVTAETVKSVSFDKIIEAINVTQERMGIMGTTAAEASGTISGSISTMKAAYENLKTAIASGSGVDAYINDFIESVETVTDNLTPVGKRVVLGTVKLVRAIAPAVIAEIPTLVKEVSPEIQGAAFDLIGTLGNTLLNGGAETLLDTSFDLLMNFLDGLLVAITDGKAIDKLTDFIIDLAFGITDPEMLKPLLSASIAIVVALATGIAQNSPEMIKAVPEIVKNIISALADPSTQKELQGAGRQIIFEMWNGIASTGSWLWEKISGFFSGIFNIGGSSSGGGISGWFNGLFDGSHAGGLSYVPYDGYVAELHRGERVLTAKEAKEYKSGADGKGTVINITVNGANYSDERTLANEISRALQNMLDRRNAVYA